MEKTLFLPALVMFICLKEEFEDTKGAIRIRKSKDRQYNDRRTDNTMIEGQTIQ